MNVNDFDAAETPDSPLAIIRAIFAKQLQLMNKYQVIEGLPDAPVSVHTHAGQRVLKDFAWRTVEELAESYEAIEKHADVRVARDHALEELADAMHFFTELCIFAGITPDECYQSMEAHVIEISRGQGSTIPLYYWRATYHLGIAMNFLRNKAWKQSQVPTDEIRLKVQLLKTWAYLVDVWSAWRAQGEIWHYYSRKAQVNEFRQRSAY